jgi:replicative DNA helicase
MSGNRLAMPQNIEVEQALLGAILLNAAALDFVENVVEPEDFSEHLHSEFFDKLRSAHDSGRKVDVHEAPFPARPASSTVLASAGPT